MEDGTRQTNTDVDPLFPDPLSPAMKDFQAEKAVVKALVQFSQRLAAIARRSHFAYAANATFQMAGILLA